MRWSWLEAQRQARRYKENLVAHGRNGLIQPALLISKYP